MQLERIREPVADELRQVDRVIAERLASDVVLVNQVSQYIIGGGGKRLRPLSVVLAARACGYDGDQPVDAAALIDSSVILDTDPAADRLVRTGSRALRQRARAWDRVRG